MNLENITACFSDPNKPFGTTKEWSILRRIDTYGTRICRINQDNWRIHCFAIAWIQGQDSDTRALYWLNQDGRNGSLEAGDVFYWKHTEITCERCAKLVEWICTNNRFSWAESIDPLRTTKMTCPDNTNLQLFK